MHTQEFHFLAADPYEKTWHSHAPVDLKGLNDHFEDDYVDQVCPKNRTFSMLVRKNILHKNIIVATS